MASTRPERLNRIQATNSHASDPTQGEKEGPHEYLMCKAIKLTLTKLSFREDISMDLVRTSLYQVGFINFFDPTRFDNYIDFSCMHLVHLIISLFHAPHCIQINQCTQMEVQVHCGHSDQL